MNLWHCWEESSSEVRKICSGEFYQGSDGLVGVGKEFPASAAWGMQSPARSVALSSVVSCDHCHMPYRQGKSDVTTEYSDLLQTLVKINEYILAVLSPSFDCSPSQRQPWYRAESSKIYEKAGGMQVAVAFLGMGVVLGMMKTPIHFQHFRWKVPDAGNLGACDQNLSQWNNWAKLARAIE